MSHRDLWGVTGNTKLRESTIIVLLVGGLEVAPMPIPEAKTFHVQGMHCQHCKKVIESMVGKLSGVESVNADLKSGTVEVRYNVEQVDSEAIEGAISGAGYDISK
jgi:copper chaperone